MAKDEKNPEGEGLIVMPTEYMTQLEPEEAIAQLRTYVQTLAENVEQRAQKDVAPDEGPEERKKLMFELELARSYLARVLERWKAAQNGNSK